MATLLITQLSSTRYDVASWRWFDPGREFPETAFHYSDGLTLKNTQQLRVLVPTRRPAALQAADLLGCTLWCRSY